MADPRTNRAHGQSGQEDYKNEAKKLRIDLTSMVESLGKLKEWEREANGLLHALKHLDETVNAAPPPMLLSDKLTAIKKIAVDLQLRIPLPHNLSSTDLHADRHRRIEGGSDDLDVPDLFRDKHFHDTLEESLAFRDFLVVYESLKSETKKCLLCFAAIPKNKSVKKRLMINWWMAEGFLSPDQSDAEEESYEKAAGRILQELVKKGCVEPVNGEGRFVVNSYQMTPFIRSAVIVLADKEGFFNFHHETRDPIGIQASSGRACLISGFSQEMVDIVYGWLYGSSKPSPDMEKLQEPDLAKVQTIFNVSESYLDFYSSEWFSKMKNVRVLSLGSWQASARNHIVVKNTDFLKGLKTMKSLLFLNLQGISKITELPDSVCKLHNLKILDLRECHNLETLPNGISSLKKLTHLDVSKCYLLEHMPKGIASLSNLQVLKGFVIASRSSKDFCTLGDLSALKKLRKLSIETDKEDFPTDAERRTLHEHKQLRKLTITWGPRRSVSDEGNKAKQAQVATVERSDNPDARTNQESFNHLEKLDLKCYPGIEAPSWLLPKRLPNLKKLYIWGGELQNLIPVQENDKWKVEILRLKFLRDLKMDWLDLRSSFPCLTYLEKCDCPKLTFFPSTERGMWLKPESINE